MNGKLGERIACITGAASGIGHATALLFAREGATVVATDVQEDKGAQLVAAIAREGGNACFLPHDVASEDAWIGVIAEIRARFGALDVLVNNAGIGLSGPVTDMSLADWRRMQAINVDGTFLGVKHALPLMREAMASARPGGSIVNVSSIAGIKPSPNAAGYSASKGAVRMFTKAVALECAGAKDGIRVNSIHPGIIETAIWDTMIGTTEDGSNDRPRGPTLDALATHSIPFGRLGAVEEIAAGILWLASDDSSYVTGAELVIDGGRSIS